MIVDPVWNNPLVWIAAIGAVSTMVQSWINSRAITRNRDEANNNHAETAAKIAEVKQDVNGKMQELMSVSGDAREAIGKLAGAKEEHDSHCH